MLLNTFGLLPKRPSPQKSRENLWVSKRRAATRLGRSLALPEPRAYHLDIAFLAGLARDEAVASREAALQDSLAQRARDY